MATTQTDPKANRITLKRVRASYTSKRDAVTSRTVQTLFEPCQGKVNGQILAPKYGCGVILDEIKDAEQIKATEAIIERLLTEKFGPPDKRSPKLANPLRDGKEYVGKKGYGPGTRFLNPSADADHKPEVVDAIKGTDGNLVKLRKEDGRPYSGCYVNVSLQFFTFDAGVNKGVGVGLGNVQFVSHGEKLGGGASADQEFEEEEVEDTSSLLD